jgi:hypothetical protein
MVESFALSESKIMELYTASTNFLKKAQQTSMNQSIDNLNNPGPTGLLSSLEKRVKEMLENHSWPITRSESKTKVTNLYNLMKRFQSLQSQGPAALKVEFQKVISAWSDYRDNYFTNDFLLSVQRDVPKHYDFWNNLRIKIDENLENIRKILEDLQTAVVTTG